MSHKTKVLFVCVHNSARSVMAEAFLEALGGERFQVESAGLEPGPTDPLVIEAMEEIGCDVSSKTPDSVFDFYREGRLYDYVITVCDGSAGEKCPLFPGIAKRLHWPFKDPRELRGSRDEKLQGVRRIRDEIESRVEAWLQEEFQTVGNGPRAQS